MEDAGGYPAPFKRECRGPQCWPGDAAGVERWFSAPLYGAGRATPGTHRAGRPSGTGEHAGALLERPGVFLWFVGPAASAETNRSIVLCWYCSCWEGGSAPGGAAYGPVAVRDVATPMQFTCEPFV